MAQSSTNGARYLLLPYNKLGDQIRFLFVGPHQLSIQLHLDLLPKQTQQWLTTKEIRYDPTGLNFPCYPLPDQDPGTVNLYRLWLYTGKLFSITPDDVDVEDDGEVEAHEDAEWHKLVLMYLLGVEARDEKFANIVVNALVEKTYGDKLRKLYVDLHVWVGQGIGIRNPHEDAAGPWEFLDDVRSSKFVAGRKIYDPEQNAPYEDRLCELYHKHDLTAMCGLEGMEVLDLTAEDG
ncbi:hypothetical protein CLAFUW4_00267 [Fulvia fulva]|uniref:Uncharacterized protein n=1 Tax=Passalora fulva TaxID=5499 RepID=A0A9Q8P4B8_PASFU|nr:uncharacterized protein CLAFUR5_00269 [Fulvia fulva]KAK4634268.1 hypothetical protein CLAFUR4_00267 [Fulvia fulva]KAK4637197.1 hypothetical protein CLAFUR0_00268 [Fulvia fulva]UJO12689.1 hypothetical protein CLAFUR5_00269 [Fulvia fulva]WPV08313.1 hypothetical protein CLAFUW4_00267 [Fulvia fulva]WPV23957.1 hypothetical protein CLAFUW7_00271 [Fulvia fulva]